MRRKATASSNANCKRAGLETSSSVERERAGSIERWNVERERAGSMESLNAECGRAGSKAMSNQIQKSNVGPMTSSEMKSKINAGATG